MIDSEFLGILACPVCKSDVEPKGEELVCTNERCKLRFTVVDGIPIMLPPGTTYDLMLTKEKWEQRYQSQTVEKVDLKNDPELRDDLAHIKKYMKSKGGLFLEAGSGSSRISCVLAKEGVRTVGIDISPSAVKGAQRLFETEHVNGFLINGDMLKLPLKDSSISFIYAGGSIEHCRDTQQSVNELCRCLSPGGLLTAGVPSISLSTPYIMLRGNIPDMPVINSIIETLQLRVLKGKYMTFGYEKSFTVKKIKKVFKNAGFTNIEAGLFELYYPLVMFRNKFIKKMLTRIARMRPFWPMIYVNGQKVR